MVIKLKDTEPRSKWVTYYHVEDHQSKFHHVAYQIVTPERSFGPHAHKGDEIWFILKGNAVVDIGGDVTEVEENDLIVCPENVSHGMTSDGEVHWLCIG